MAGSADFIAAINADTPKAFYQCQEASGTIVDSVAGGTKSLTNLFGSIAYHQAGPLDTDFSIRFPAAASAFSNAAASVVTDNFTLGFWAKLGGGSISNDRRALMNGSGGNRGWEIEVDLSGTINYGSNAGATGGANSTGALTTGGWKLIHVVRRAGTWEYYLNGALDTANAGTDTPTAPFAGDTTQLGASADLDIYLAYAFIFETALSPSRIQAQLAAAVGSYAATVLTDNPLAYYRLNETSGLPQDSSGNGNHMVFTNGTPTYSQSGALASDPTDTAIRFDRASTESFAAADQLAPAYTDVFTLEAWVKRSSTSGSRQEGIVTKGDNVGGMYFQNNTLMLAKTSVGIIVQSTTTITDTTSFHHLVVTKNGATSNLYIDGVDVTGVVSNLTCTTDAGHGQEIGAEFGTAECLDGIADEVAVYATALTQSQILSHYNAGISKYSAAVLADAPVAYYRMNEAAALQTAILDAFTGADETPIATNWSGPWYPGVGQMRRLSNAMSAPASTQGGSWYDLATFGPDCEVYVTITTFGADGNDLQLYARMQSPGTTSLSGYILIFEPRAGGADFFRMYREDSGSDTLLDSDDTITWGAGDQIALRCIGSNIQGWRKPSGGEWRQILEATDGTYSTAGYFGVGTSAGTFVLDNFGGGTVTSTSNIPRDSSGNGNHMTYVNGTPDYAQAGPIASDTTDTGINLSDASNEFFSAPDATTLDYGDTFSMECWLKRTDFSTREQGVVTKGGEATAHAGGMYLINNFLSGAQTGIGYFVQANVTIPNDSNYYHCVITKNGATRLVYLNSVDVTNTGAFADKTCTNTTQPLAIGTEYSVGTPQPVYLTSVVSEVAVYAAALSPAQVLAHYQAAQAEAAAGMHHISALSAVGF